MSVTGTAWRQARHSRKNCRTPGLALRQSKRATPSRSGMKGAAFRCTSQSLSKHLTIKISRNSDSAYQSLRFPEQPQIDEVIIGTEDRLEKVLDMVFDKAMAEPVFCKLCAQHLGSRYVTKKVVKDGQEVVVKVEFRRLLIQKKKESRRIYEGIEIAGRVEEVPRC